MADLTFSGVLSFSSTNVEVSAHSDAGRAFLAPMGGPACVGITLRKSAAERLLAECELDGLRIEVR